MRPRTIILAALVILSLGFAACAGSPPSSQPAASKPATDNPTPAPASFGRPSSAPAPGGSNAITWTPTSLLPDGIWQVELSEDDLVAAGAPARTFPTGTYRWTFDGTRARIDLITNSCDADAVPADQAVRLSWHPVIGCGGWDTISWSLEADGLHVALVENGSGDEAGTKALFEAKPWQPVEGDATLSWSDAWRTCANPDGGACLNKLDAGTYTTSALTPPLTYTVPDGWQNLEDFSGDVVLIAPGFGKAQIDAGEADAIAVHSSVRATNRKCATEEEADSDQPGVAHTPRALAAEFQARPGLATTRAKAVSIGGLSGLVMDIRIAPDWKGTCFLGIPVVTFLGGIPPSDFGSAVMGDQALRLYLLARGNTTLAIEINDLSGGAHLDDYSAIVEQFQFGD